MRWMFASLLICSSCAAQGTQPATTEMPPMADLVVPPATAPGAPAAAPAASPAADATTNDLLDAMHKVGIELKTLKANVAMQTVDNSTGADSTRSGTFILERRSAGDTRAHVTFDKLVLDEGKKVFREKIEYLLDGDWVTDRVYGRGANDPGGKRETRRQIRPPGDKTDLLKLGEGPFPLPIGQPREAVRNEFEVTRLPDDKAKPGLIGLELRPKANNRLSKRFETITVWVNPADAMPRVIETLDAGTPSLRTTTLENVQINAGVTDADFTLEPIDQNTWMVVSEKYRE